MNSDWLPPNAVPPPAPMQLPPFLTDLSDRLQSAAVDLRPQHVAEVGFRSHAALDAVAELAARNLAILGGDVWVADEGSAPEPAYDNWHADLGPQEAWGDYVRRSEAHARDRIMFFDSIQPTGTARFVLVPCSEQRYEDLMAEYGHLLTRRQGLKGEE